MTTREPRNRLQPGKAPGGKKHDWLMIACCVPMIAIAAILVATGVAGPGFLIVAVMCTVMMAVMMRSMDSHG